MIPLAVQRAAVEHAIEAFPEESCGLFVTAEDGAVQYVRVRNIHEDPRAGFEVPMADYLAWGDRVEGVAHSHPVPSFGPSWADMRAQLDFGVPFYITVLDHRGQYQDFFGWGDQLPVAPLLGRTFRPGVHDCYAAYRDFQWLAFGHRVPDFPREYQWWEPDDNGRTAENPLPIHVQSPCFEPVAELADLQVGDGLLLALRSTEVNHCAAYAGDGLIYHHLQGKISRRDPLVQWSRFVRQIVRYRKDAGAT